MSLMEERQKKAIINAYNYRLKATNINVNNKDLENKFIKFSNDDLNKFLSNIISTDSNNISFLLNKLNIPNTNINQINNNISDETPLNNNSNSLGGRQYVLKTKNNIMGNDDEKIA